jgi:hypothetical protein
MLSEDVHSQDVNKAVEDEDQVMDFVTLGMFIIGMLTPKPVFAPLPDCEIVISSSMYLPFAISSVDDVVAALKVILWHQCVHIGTDLHNPTPVLHLISHH